MECIINKFDHFGNGISKIDNKVIFINRALIGETVNVKIVRDKKNFQVADITNIIKESPLRVKAVCPYYDKCGGCNFLHTTYDNEINFKKDKALNILDRIDGFYETKEMNYRNKVTLHVNKKELGFYEEGTHKIIAIDYCYLLNDKINEVIKQLNVYIKNNCHDIKKVVIKSNEKDVLMDIEGKIEENFLNFFDVDTIINNGKIIKGKGYIEELINGNRYRISAKSFFQVNKQGFISISNIIKDYLQGNKYNKALDLYSGTSALGILISPYVKNVTSIELCKEATKDALVNIKNNDIRNLQVICGKVEDYIEEFKDIDLVIIDPPRSGLDKKTKEYLIKISPKTIIYVSCDMMTLKRDITDLSTLYNLQKVNLVDMFKRTYHVECVCVLKLR